MNEIKNKIAKMDDKQLAEIRARFDAMVVTPRKNPAEFAVLVALNGECQKRGINF